MNQKNLVWWIESAEARTVCALATENPTSVAFVGRSIPRRSNWTIDTLRLEEYLRWLGRRLAPSHRARPAS